jgi:tetratricopeptide (TPR) repeat protein
VVVGRRSLQADEGWRKLNQDRTLLYVTQLQKFSKNDTENYLKQIGIQNGGTRAKLYRATQGLPYYLDWVRKQREDGKEPDFSKGNQAIAELLLQGTDSQQRKILQVVACCRWFDLAMMRYLLKCNIPGLQQANDTAEDYFEWLKRSDFVEFSKGHYRLDDVARDVFRQSYFQDDQNQFRKTNALLADYFERQANKLVDPQTPLPDSYEDEEWRGLIAEFLYYSLLGKGREGLHQYIEQVFIAAYLREPDVFIVPFAFISAELSEESQTLLPRATDKFFKDSAIALGFGWIFLGKPPKSYKLEFEGEDDLSEEVIEARLKKLEDALQVLLEQIDNVPDGSGKCIGLIYKSLRCKRSRETIDSLLQAKRQTELLTTHYRPKLLHSLFSNLGVLLNGVERYQDALDCCETALELWEGNPQNFIEKGVALGNLKRYEEALESFQKAIDLDPKSVTAWINRGVALSNLERYEEALESFQKAIDLDPKSVNVWINRGAALSNLERYEEALESFQKVIDLDPKSVDAWREQGDALRVLKRYSEALVACDRALEIAPENSGALNSQALTLSFLQDFDKAIAAIDQAIHLSPEEALYKANRGIVLARAGRYSEALADCDQAIQQDPKHEGGYYAKACYYALQGEIEQAINNLQTSIELAPSLSRREAKHNPDFNCIRDDERFRALVYLE